MLAGTVIVGLGYFNIVPSIAKTLGTDKARDIGVEYTDADLKSAQIKTGVQLKELRSDNRYSVIYTGANAIDNTFTQEELTALINSSKWIYCPVKDLQLKINSDGTMEISGILLSDRLAGYAEAMGFGISDIQLAKDKLRIGAEANFYLVGTLEIIDNKVNLNLSKVEINRIPIPSSLVDSNREAIETFVENRMQAVTGLSIQSFKIEDGKLTFKGTVPAIEETVQSSE